MLSTTMPPPLELTLVVAATRQMGIGKGGTLPWTGLRNEMAYFARVTKRVSTANDSPSSPAMQNVVIMGRKTWESIPPKFRPLKDRLNIVISRSHPDTPPPPPSSGHEHTAPPEAIKLGSLEAVVKYLRKASQSCPPSSSSPTSPQPLGGGKVFIMGGGEIYAAALQLKEARRVLLTSVLTDFECDTFFPDITAQGSGWERQSKEAHDAWVGEEVPAGEQEEGGTRYEFQMWERND